MRDVRGPVHSYKKEKETLIFFLKESITPIKNLPVVNGLGKVPVGSISTNNLKEKKRR